MKWKVILIVLIALTIICSIAIAIWQRQQMNNIPPAPTESPQTSAAPTPTISVQPTNEVLPAETLQPDDIAPNPTSNSARPFTHAFNVTINGKMIQIANGVEEAILDKGPGWQESSAAPGTDGMCVIYGHRNRTHLRILETVEAGDTIKVSMPDGAQYNYTVTSTQAFESTADLTLPTVDGKSIALVTCYPFRYSGNAPGKYLVIGMLDSEITN